MMTTCFLRRGRPAVFSALAALLLTSCAAGPEPVRTTVTGGGPGVLAAVAYEGPRARVAVSRFDVKAAKATGEVGSGLSDMLTSALFRSGRFVVLERGSGLEDLREEIDLAESGYVDPTRAAARGGWEGADILVTGVLTAFEPEAAGSGGWGFIIPLPARLGGGVRMKRDEAYLATEIRLVDVRTGRVVNATRVEGHSSRYRVGGAGGGLIGGILIGGALERYRNTPMEQALMVMIEDAVNEISRLVPEDYYRHEPGGGDS